MSLPVFGVKLYGFAVMIDCIVDVFLVLVLDGLVVVFVRSFGMPGLLGSRFSSSLLLSFGTVSHKNI